MQKTIYHFKDWLQGWDERISTMEGTHSKNAFQKRIDKSISTIDLFLAKTDERAMLGITDEVERVKAMLKNQEKESYKSLTAVRDDLLMMRYEIERVYDFQHRVVAENFELKSKIRDKK